MRGAEEEHEHRALRPSNRRRGTSRGKSTNVARPRPRRRRREEGRISNEQTHRTARRPETKGINTLECGYTEEGTQGAFIVWTAVGVRPTRPRGEVIRKAEASRRGIRITRPQCLGRPSHGRDWCDSTGARLRPARHIVPRCWRERDVPRRGYSGRARPPPFLKRTSPRPRGSGRTRGIRISHCRCGVPWGRWTDLVPRRTSGARSEETDGL